MCHFGHRTQDPEPLDRIRINCPNNSHFLIKKKNVTVEYPGTAFCAACAPEPDLPDHICETMNGILK